MTFKEEYLNYFKNYIDAIFTNAGKKITTAVHDEFYYEDDEDVNADFTLKFLPGQIQSGICQYPAEIYIQIEEPYKDDVLNALNDFIAGVNETVVTLDNFNYKQFYTLPSILSAFQNGQTKRIVTASISLSLFEFKVCGVSSIVIDNETIGFVAHSMAYVAETNATGGLSTLENKSTGEIATRTMTFTYVPMIKTSMAATTKIFNLLYGYNPSPNTSFSVKIVTTIPGTSAFTATWIVKDCDLSQEINGFPTVRVTMLRQ